MRKLSQQGYSFVEEIINFFGEAIDYLERQYTRVAQYRCRHLETVWNIDGQTLRTKCTRCGFVSVGIDFTPDRRRKEDCY